MLKRLIYLASPYSDPDPDVQERRHEIVCKAAAQLMARGEFIYSPIAHTHAIAKHGDLPGNFEYWAEYDRCMLEACCKMVILKDAGWEYSKGIQAERLIAQELMIPVEFMEL